MKHSELRGIIELVPDIIQGRKGGVVVADDFRHCAHAVSPVDRRYRAQTCHRTAVPRNFHSLAVLNLFQDPEQILA
jgi:hypothetical protein